MQPFDLLDAPLEGVNLIEASAGTGKTYNIEGLFMRLVLESRLQVDQILVLTFTKAATEELRDRIRTKLVQAREGFAAGGSTDPLIDSLLKSYPDRQGTALRIQEALIDFDQAAIYTIHGFCQRLLHENAFETNSLFDTELVENQSQIAQEIVDDFWRESFYTAPPEWIGFALDRIKSPDFFMRLLNQIKSPDVKIVPRVAKPGLETLQPFRDALQALKKAWPASRDAVTLALANPGLNATIYGRLATDADHPDVSPRALKIKSLADRMDHLAHPHSTGFPLFEKFENFTAAKLIKATKKNHHPPTHEFFNLCDTVFNRAAPLEVEFEKSLVSLKARFFEYAACELHKRKRVNNIQYFDDLLSTVLNALKSENALQLVTGIRRRYQAALIDEFQDTDSVQYDILTRLFAHEDGLLFMIGDPKQSIYSFRGADIFSYMRAARNAEARFTLLKNWRSEPKLIAAINHLFSTVQHPFVFDEIPFQSARSAQTSTAQALLKGPPLIVWYLDSRETTGTDKPINKTVATKLVAAAVGDEIVRLVSQPKQLDAGEIAVLVRTNLQAQLIKDTLTALDVPSVLYTSADIFDSREAGEIEQILTAIARPSDTARIKAALATEIMGCQAAELVSAEVESRWWDSRIGSFGDYLQVWEHDGFIHMFRLFLAREAVKDRLLSFADGERRLTNVLHLSELLHRQSTAKITAVGGLLKWLADQRNPATQRREENQLRLESDDNAVKIVTIHKSKGLEYPVVFCPFSWEGASINTSEFAFHDPAGNLQLTFDLGTAERDRHLILARNERLAEDLRLLYVALTRAKQRCYMTWGHINAAATSALAYLLLGGADQSAGFPAEDRTRLLKHRFKGKSSADLLGDLEELAAESEGSIRVGPLPTPGASTRNHSHMQADQEQRFCRRFTGKIDRSWKISSYSSLVSAGISDVDLPDRDGSTGASDPNQIAPAVDAASAGESDGKSIFSFPRGPRAGSFFHDILENCDFSPGRSKQLERLVAGRLQQYGFEAHWLDTVCATVETILTASLHSNLPQLTLSSLTAAERIHEMEFYYPLSPTTPSKLRQAFKDLDRSKRFGRFPASLGRLAFSPSLGFMKGYIDMVFQYQGRFYLLDWKTNHLGPTLDQYDQPCLQKIMETNYYILQYHLYTLALHQYLRHRHPDYRYESDFGGVFYIFVRGVNAHKGPENGVFYDLPDPDLIHSLAQTLIPGYR